MKRTKVKNPIAPSKLDINTEVRTGTFSTYLTRLYCCTFRHQIQRKQDDTIRRRKNCSAERYGKEKKKTRQTHRASLDVYSCAFNSFSLLSLQSCSFFFSHLRGIVRKTFSYLHFYRLGAFISLLLFIFLARSKIQLFSAQLQRCC